MAKSSFIYETHIRTTPEALGEALIEPDKIRLYWFDGRLASDWTVGSEWRFLSPDGRLINSGAVLETARPRRLALSWRNELKPGLRAEGYSRVLFEGQQQGETIKLTLTHEIDRAASALIDDVAGGWPIILSSLKSLLETGSSLEATRHWPNGL